MRIQVFLAGLAIAGLLAGCLVRSEPPVAEEKVLGNLVKQSKKGFRNMGDALRGGDAGKAGKAGRVARSLSDGELDELIVSAEHMQTLRTVLVRGGNEVRQKFTLLPVQSVNEVADDLSNRLQRAINASNPLPSGVTLMQKELRDGLDQALGSVIFQRLAVAHVARETGETAAALRLSIDDSTVDKLVKLRGHATSAHEITDNFPDIGSDLDSLVQLIKRQDKPAADILGDNIKLRNVLKMFNKPSAYLTHDIIQSGKFRKIAYERMSEVVTGQSKNGIIKPGQATSITSTRNQL